MTTPPITDFSQPLREALSHRCWCPSSALPVGTKTGDCRPCDYNQHRVKVDNNDATNLKAPSSTPLD